ncbi:methionine--tRNA ligase, mitochondrial-like [Crassostrea virginica]
MDRMNKLTMSGFRYFLLKSGSVFTSCNYNGQVAKEVINAEVVNTYLNLLSRSSSKSINKRGVLPSFTRQVSRHFSHRRRGLCSTDSHICQKLASPTTKACFVTKLSLLIFGFYNAFSKFDEFIEQIHLK